MVQTHFVKFGSQAWGEARRIRYSVFFEPHDLPLSVMDDSQETDAIHLVAIEVSQVVGYGRLFDLGHGQFQIFTDGDFTESSAPGDRPVITTNADSQSSKSRCHINHLESPLTCGSILYEAGVPTVWRGLCIGKDRGPPRQYDVKGN